ncbi:camp-regulated phospho protein/endosulfine conserved region-domain-containing protein [Schizophyllum amplum]|uniref:mRNA stability protein n=1 Tax=Schizophyllum amplum TaxID=97359 RepID=A0A550C8E1_9AGAR|nr:camp-regulated phospho protein/endosulfine conserved region-domain-containing protein [Auriculariopsis ampla]
MHPAKLKKIDTSAFSEQEKQLFAKYGKVPTHKNVLMKMQKDRKYFDSGDYALSKAGVAPQNTVGTAIPNPEKCVFISSYLCNAQPSRLPSIDTLSIGRRAVHCHASDHHHTYAIIYIPHFPSVHGFRFIRILTLTLSIPHASSPAGNGHSNNNNNMSTSPTNPTSPINKESGRAPDELPELPKSPVSPPAVEVGGD